MKKCWIHYAAQVVSLEQTLSFINKQLREKEAISLAAETTEEFISIQQQIKEFAENNLFGCDFDPFLCRYIANERGDGK